MFAAAGCFYSLESLNPQTLTEILATPYEAMRL
jgi:hypothetical protein